MKDAKEIVAVILLLCLIVLTGTAVKAEDETLSLTAPDIGDASITLDGTTQLVLFAVDNTNQPLSISDLRETGDGWYVTLQATQFDNHAGKMLPQGSFRLHGFTVLGDSNADPAEWLAKSHENSAIDDDNPVKILEADIDEGRGQYLVRLNDLILTVKPENAYATTYSTTVTFTIISGPKG